MSKISFNRKYLITINIVWFLSALIYDLDKLARLPSYLMPFFAICPIYPLLLAFYWISSRRKRPNDYLTAFAVQPPICFFAVALVYYPYWQSIHGFDWLASGQIFWIALYGLQAVYLASRTSGKFLPFCLAGLFSIINLLVILQQKGNNYFDTTEFSFAGYAIILTAALLAITLTLIVIKRNSPHSELRAIP